jgi:plasmid stabilization system protein ParE
MAARTVSWTLTAELQLLSVLEFWTIRNQSTAYAEKLLVDIEVVTDGLRGFPYRSPESTYPGVRVAAMGPYSLLYKIESQTIRVVAFWDNRQDPEKLLHFLKSARPDF